MLILKDFVKKIKKLILKEGASLSISFFCRNIAKMQWKATKNGYFYIRVASRNITTEVQ